MMNQPYRPMYAHPGVYGNPAAAPYPMTNGAQYPMMPMQPGVMPQQPHMMAQAMQRSPQPTKMGNGIDDVVGDELDEISTRDIAMARYKRNHDYLSEIFTPYSASTISPPPMEISTTKDDLQRLIEENEAKTQELKERYEERMAQLRQEREKFWTSFHHLKEATTVEAVDTTTLGPLKIVFTEANVRTLQIPGEPDDDDPIISPKNGTHQPAPTITNISSIEPADDTNDYMFNEMVNADDDPSVNEFLNTNDMEFDTSQ